MSEKSKIQWTDDTYNPWRGCTKVSDGCKNCYAETLITTRLAHVHYDAATSGSDKRTSKQFHKTAGGHSTSGIQFWGKGAPRIRAVDLNEPLRWNKKPVICNHCGKAFDVAQTHKCVVARHGAHDFHRRRVFSLSLGDWLDNEVPIAWLTDFLDVVRRCENLDWLLVTKRPELWKSRIEGVLKWLEANDCKWPGNKTSSLPLRNYLADWFVLRKAPPNVMVLVSVEDQKAADKRIPELLKIPAARRGLSCEPLLGPVDLRGKDAQGSALDAYERDPKIDWVIVGGESGPGSRASDLEWMRSIVGQCKLAGVPVFVKQLGANVQRSLFASSIPPVPIQYKHPKGGDMTEWPEDLQVREFYK